MVAAYWEGGCSFGLRCVSWYKCLIVSLVFSHLSFWSGNLFLVAPFPDLCLLVPFCYFSIKVSQITKLCSEIWVNRSHFSSWHAILVQ